MTDTRITDFEAVAPMPIYTQADLDAAVAKALAAQKLGMPRKESLPIREYLDWISKGKTLEQIAEATGRSVSSVYEALKRRGLPTCARHYLLWKANGGRYD